MGRGLATLIKPLQVAMTVLVETLDRLCYV